MTDTFATWALRRGGFFTRGEAKDCGFSDAQIQGATRSGYWVRLRHGYYAHGDYVATLDEGQRHRLLSRAVLHRLGTAYTLVGISACIAHGIEMWDSDLDTSIVHVARLGRRSGRSEAGIQFHSIDPDSDIMVVNDLTAVRADLAIWQAGPNLSTEGSLVCINSATHQRIVCLEELASAGARLVNYPRTRHLRLAFTMADPRIESVGESRSFFLCWEFHLPRPEPQVKVIDKRGIVIARSDLGWRKFRYLAEFDGMVKYERGRRPDESASQVVVREKRREELVRDEDWDMGRLIWYDLGGRQRRRSADRLRTGMDKAHSRYARGRTIIT